MATFVNSATLTYNGNITNSNTVTGELLEVLSATKTAVTDSYGSNDRIAYVVSIVNTGTSAFTGLSLSDDLGTYTFGETTLTPLDYVDGSVLYYANGVLQATPAVTAGPPLTITGISVPAGGNATIIYEAQTNQYAPLGDAAEILNTVTVSGSGITELTAAETVTHESEPLLTISKAICPTTVTENGQLTYTFVIQNFGSRSAETTDEVVLTDSFNPILDPISVSFNAAAWTEGTNYSYDTTTGLFTTAADQITVPAATYTQDAETGVWVTTPGVSTLVVTGTV